jgi:hypothetical protein
MAIATSNHHVTQDMMDITQPHTRLRGLRAGAPSQTDGVTQLAGAAIAEQRMQTNTNIFNIAASTSLNVALRHTPEAERRLGLRSSLVGIDSNAAILQMHAGEPIRTLILGLPQPDKELDELARRKPDLACAVQRVLLRGQEPVPMTGKGAGTRPSAMLAALLRQPEIQSLIKEICDALEAGQDAASPPVLQEIDFAAAELGMLAHPENQSIQNAPIVSLADVDVGRNGPVLTLVLAAGIRAELARRNARVRPHLVSYTVGPVGFEDLVKPKGRPDHETEAYGLSVAAAVDRVLLERSLAELPGYERTTREAIFDTVVSVGIPGTPSDARRQAFLRTWSYQQTILNHLLMKYQGKLFQQGVQDALGAEDGQLSPAGGLSLGDLVNATVKLIAIDLEFIRQVAPTIYIETQLKELRSTGERIQQEVVDEAAINEGQDFGQSRLGSLADLDGRVRLSSPPLAADTVDYVSAVQEGEVSLKEAMDAAQRDLNAILSGSDINGMDTAKLGVVAKRTEGDFQHQEEVLLAERTARAFNNQNVAGFDEGAARYYDSIAEEADSTADVLLKGFGEDAAQRISRSIRHWDRMLVKRMFAPGSHERAGLALLAEAQNVVNHARTVLFSAECYHVYRRAVQEQAGRIRGLAGSNIIAAATADTALELLKEEVAAAEATQPTYETDKDLLGPQANDLDLVRGIVATSPLQVNPTVAATKSPVELIDWIKDQALAHLTNQVLPNLTVLSALKGRFLTKFKKGEQNALEMALQTIQKGVLDAAHQPTLKAAYPGGQHDMGYVIFNGNWTPEITLDSKAEQVKMPDSDSLLYVGFVRVLGGAPLESTPWFEQGWRDFLAWQQQRNQLATIPSNGAAVAQIFQMDRAP